MLSQAQLSPRLPASLVIICELCNHSSQQSHVSSPDHSSLTDDSRIQIKFLPPDDARCLCSCFFHFTSPSLTNLHQCPREIMANRALFLPLRHHFQQPCNQRQRDPRAIHSYVIAGLYFCLRLSCFSDINRFACSLMHQFHLAQYFLLQFN